MHYSSPSLGKPTPSQWVEAFAIKEQALRSQDKTHRAIRDMESSEDGLGCAPLSHLIRRSLQASVRGGWGAQPARRKRAASRRSHRGAAVTCWELGWGHRVKPVGRCCQAPFTPATMLLTFLSPHFLPSTPLPAHPGPSNPYYPPPCSLPSLPPALGKEPHTSVPGCTTLDAMTSSILPRARTPCALCKLAA